ncbi:MAG: hypothetical protein H7070_07455 [Saprospiraceae bacterium]|nr:hypothetical protein [Pyrinomonadaceae bacterium]
MKTYIIFTIVFFLFLFLPNINAQTPAALDRYLDESKTILIAKCTYKGAVKANLTGEITIQILHVVKGTEKIREISFNSRYGLEVGKRYLIRSLDEPTTYGRYFDIKDLASAVQIPDHEDLELLQTLSPRIVVLRIMNQRASDLESEMRIRQYELDALNQVLRDQ